MSWINLHVNRVLPLSISLEERVSRLSLSGYKKGTFIYHSFNKYLGLSGGSDSKESTCNAGRPRFNPWVGKIPWRRKWQPTPAFSPGEVHGQRSHIGYIPRGRKDSGTTEAVSQSVSSVAQSCPTLCNPMNHSMPGLPVHHHLPEFTQTHVHRVSDAIQPSYPLSSPSPPAPNPSQHQSLFQWVNSSHEVAKVTNNKYLSSMFY